MVAPDRLGRIASRRAVHPGNHRLKKFGGKLTSDVSPVAFRPFGWRPPPVPESSIVTAVEASRLPKHLQPGSVCGSAQGQALLAISVCRRPASPSKKRAAQLRLRKTTVRQRDGRRQALPASSSCTASNRRGSCRRSPFRGWHCGCNSDRRVNGQARRQARTLPWMHHTMCYKYALNLRIFCLNESRYSLPRA